MTNTIQVSPQAQAEMLWLMAENDSKIIPANLFKIICAKYPVEQSTPIVIDETATK